MKDFMIRLFVTFLPYAGSKYLRYDLMYSDSDYLEQQLKEIEDALAMHKDNSTVEIPLDLLLGSSVPAYLDMAQGRSPVLFIAKQNAIDNYTELALKEEEKKLTLTRLLFRPDIKWTNANWLQRLALKAVRTWECFDPGSEQGYYSTLMHYYEMRQYRVLREGVKDALYDAKEGGV